MGGTPFQFAMCIHTLGGYFFREDRLGVDSREFRGFGGDERCGVGGFGGLAEYFVGHLRECRAAQGFGVEVSIIEFAVDFPGLNLTDGDLLFDVVEDHQEMFAFLGIGCVIVGHGDYSAVILHNDGGELHGDVELLQEGNEKVEFFGECEDRTGLCVGR